MFFFNMIFLLFALWLHGNSCNVGTSRNMPLRTQANNVTHYTSDWHWMHFDDQRRVASKTRTCYVRVCNNHFLGWRSLYMKYLWSMIRSGVKFNKKMWSNGGDLTTTFHIVMRLRLLWCLHFCKIKIPSYKIFIYYYATNARLKKISKSMLLVIKLNP